MKKSTLYLKAMTNLVFYIVAAVLIIIFVPKFLVFFLPFVIGWIVSAIANPVCKFFEEKIKFKRKFMSAIMIVLIIAVIIFAGYGIISFLINQGIGLVQSIPEKWPSWQKTLDNWGVTLNSWMSVLPENTQNALNNFGLKIEEGLANFIGNLGSGSGATGKIMSSISSGIGSVASFIIGVIMCVLSAYFFTVEHNSLIKGMEKHLSSSSFESVMAAYRGLKNAVGGYFKAQFKIEVVVYIITVTGLLIGRIDYAFVIALGIAIMDFLPFFGAGIIMVPWAIIAFVNADYFIAIVMIVTWGVGQLVRQLIQPKFVGESIGVAPLPTLILLFIGYKIGGMFGMIIALPVAMIFISLYREGVFKSFTDSLKILWNGLSEFRHMPSNEESTENGAKTEEKESSAGDGK